MAGSAPWARVILTRSGWDRCKPLLHRSEAWVFELAAVGIAVDCGATGAKALRSEGGSDMDVGTLLLMLGLSCALGLLWYDLLPGKLPQQVWRVAAYPFLGIFVAEALLPSVLAFDPKFGNLHLLTVLIGSLVAVVVDWIIQQARRPSLVLTPEARAAAA